MKVKELRTLTRDELAQRLRDSRDELFNLRFQQKTGQLASPIRIRQVRKDIARLITLLKESEPRGAAAADQGTK